VPAPGISGKIDVRNEAAPPSGNGTALIIPGISAKKRRGKPMNGNKNALEE
jgi:hypothetical protein